MLPGKEDVRVPGRGIPQARSDRDREKPSGAAEERLIALGSAAFR
jgi:hypothetical protein